MTVAKNTIQKKLFQAINDSLALLNQATHKERSNSLEIPTPIPNLLEQCVELCEQHQSQAQEPIRIIHHFGLPLNSSLFPILATIPNTQVLNDIRADFDTREGSIQQQGFVEKSIEPTSTSNQNTKNHTYQTKVLLHDLEQIQQENNHIGRRLLICDNHCLPETESTQTTDLLTLLNQQFSTRSLVIVNDPVDSYLDYFSEQTQKNRSALDFEKYCQCILSFLQANPELLVVHYKDFIDTPEMVMDAITNMLNLPVCDDFLLVNKAFITSNTKALVTCLDKGLSTSIPYQQLCVLLNYQDQFDHHSNKTDTNGKPTSALKAEYSLKADAFYKNKSQECLKKENPPFILLDSKSIPRSGLHYMKSTFEKVLGSHFSFCEWYQEQGCCRKMPCELTAYAKHSEDLGEAKLRLIKSHDFGLNDPTFAPSYSARRIILVRDPLYVLTSYFLLDQLEAHKEHLKKEGINIQKIWLKHEPEVLVVAYKILDQKFMALSPQALTEWLDKKVNYLNGFIKKWVKPIIEDTHPYNQLVSYEQINAFIASILLEMYDFLPHKKQEAINLYINNDHKQFQRRTDPFDVKSQKVTDYLTENSDLFIAAANKITRFDCPEIE